MTDAPCRAERGEFLSRNPFPHPYTLGFFYREKMRAIHSLAPEAGVHRVLEVGGGQSGLTAMLYPQARVVNVDMEQSYAASPNNRISTVRFVCADATSLPFTDGHFDAVTMFDLLEHVPDDTAAAAEALRVVRPGGHILVSTPNERWRHPYYAWMKPICRSEDDLMAEWGHVRRGYDLHHLEKLFGAPAEGIAGFITPLTVVGHDIAFSRLPRRVRRMLCLMVAPMTLAGYAMGATAARGTEIVAVWKKR